MISVATVTARVLAQVVRMWQFLSLVQLEEVYTLCWGQWQWLPTLYPPDLRWDLPPVWALVLILVLSLTLAAGQTVTLVQNLDSEPRSESPARIVSATNTPAIAAPG